jgi:hypothetical protein
VSWHKKKKSKRKSKIFFEKRGIQHSLAAKANWIRRPLHIQKQQKLPHLSCLFPGVVIKRDSPIFRKDERKPAKLLLATLEQIRGNKSDFASYFCLIRGRVCVRDCGAVI